MKLEVGNYVRTLNGIVKIDKIQNDVIKDTKGYLHYGDFIKASNNIIDLIEVGDYVNGCKITLINEPSMANCNKRLVYAEDEQGYLIKMFDQEDIKSIVTREQIESMQYKVD